MTINLGRIIIGEHVFKFGIQLYSLENRARLLFGMELRQGI